MSKKRNKTSMKEHTWQEEPCGSFGEEVEKKIERERKKGRRKNKWKD